MKNNIKILIKLKKKNCRIILSVWPNIAKQTMLWKSSAQITQNVMLMYRLCIFLYFGEKRAVLKGSKRDLWSELAKISSDMERKITMKEHLRVFPACRRGLLGSHLGVKIGYDIF